MSDLANNIQGEHFSLPATAAFWRVRRLKEGRGAPEVVFGLDGGPLLVAVETDFDAFRAAVEDQPGRYRLDALDEARRPIEGIPAAYVAVPSRVGRAHANLVPEPPAAAAPASASPSPVAVVSHDALLAEVIRGQNQLVALMTERFSGIMVSAAELLRVFPHQVLTAPLTPPPPPPPAPTPPPGPAGPRNAGLCEPAELEADAWEGDDEPDDEREAAPPETGMVAAMTAVNSIVGEVMPVVKLFMAHRMAKAGPRPRNATPAVAEVPPVPVAVVSEPDPACGPLSLAELRHLDAIDAELEPSEARRHHLVTDDLPTPDRRAWFDSLCSLDVDNAVALIRRHIARAQRLHGGASTDRADPRFITSLASDTPEPPQEDTDDIDNPSARQPDSLTDSFDDPLDAGETDLHTCDTHGSPCDCDGVSRPERGELAAPRGCAEPGHLVITPEMITHAMEVQAALTPTESTRVLALAAEMPDCERDVWMAELSTFSVADAVQAVREALVSVERARTPAAMPTSHPSDTPVGTAPLSAPLEPSSTRPAHAPAPMSPAPPSRAAPAALESP